MEEKLPSWDVHFDLTLRVTNPRIIEDVAKIHALASVIRGIPIPPPVQQRIDRLNILRAVGGTIGIEGTELSTEEISLVMTSPPDSSPLGPGREREEQEARNANELMGYVAEYIRRNPNGHVSESLILEFHRVLTHNIDYLHNEPGQYRNHAVTVGPYRPPSTGEEVRRLMADFVHWFNTGAPKTWDPVIRAIVAHFYLVSIHPFGDGNGRTSRALESFLLYKAGVNVRGYYSLANYFYRNRPEYIDSLNLVQMRGETDLTPFVAFALTGLVQELEAVHAEVLEAVKVIAFRDYARETLNADGKLATPAGERQLQFLIGLGNDSVSLKALRSGDHSLSHLYRNVTTRTLTRDINYLKKQALVIAVNDKLRANLDLMTQFTA
ncbi:MAG: Fic family protein [Chloroflexi bacterium]|nr:Fic family protein [Chloroflexota bacterium]MYE41165.1 Fic family protein [Chloroflexota bacterium]